MSASSKGSARENDVKRRWEADGWVVIRSAGSKSAVDLVALSRFDHERWLIQVKGGLGSPWKDFVPADRAKLLELAAKAGASPLLIHWPPNGKEREYPASDWPK